MNKRKSTAKRTRKKCNSTFQINTLDKAMLCMISGFSHDGDEICNLWDFTQCRDVILYKTFWDNLSAPFSGVNKSKKNARKTYVCSLYKESCKQ